MQIPAISVVIPLYNKGPYVARAINSVLAQTFRDFQIIVVDDGSTDEGPTAISGYTDSRIQIYYQDNQGVSAARNRGVEAAQAGLVAFLDADDEWLPGFLDTVMRLKKKFPGAGAYATAVSTSCGGDVKQANYQTIKSPEWEGLVPDYFRSLFLGDSFVHSSSVAIPKNILQEMGGFKIGTKWGEDLDLWGRIALRYPIAFSTSCHSIIHVTSSFTEKIHNRAIVTKEHPFIKSAETAIREGGNVHIENRYFIPYLDKIIVNSAITNVVVGQDKRSEEILAKCKSKAFPLTRLALRIWYVMPDGAIKKNKQVRDRNLLILLTYLLKFELRIHDYIILFRYNLN